MDGNTNIHFGDQWVEAGTEDPCTGCGDCCKQLPCPLAGGHNPCLALRYHDRRYWCGLVELGIPDVSDYLLIGRGCGATMVPRIFAERDPRQMDLFES